MCNRRVAVDSWRAVDSRYNSRRPLRVEVSNDLHDCTPCSNHNENERHSSHASRLHRRSGAKSALRCAAERLICFSTTSTFKSRHIITTFITSYNFCNRRQFRGAWVDSSTCSRGRVYGNEASVGGELRRSSSMTTQCRFHGAEHGLVSASLNCYPQTL